MNEGKHYTREMTLDAPVTAVYDALTRPGRWWTAAAEAATEVGALTRLEFGDAYILFRVDRADRPTAVDWTCVDQHDEGLPQPDEWIGTRLSFRLAADGDRTHLSFAHWGLRPELDCYETCERGWDHYLPNSLKRLVETGEGEPWAATVSI